ncbi:SUN domain-containing protein, partial [Mrakia frigida]|uniref:Slp1p n=1 Tax=Mrakia frigida TaxID=29902 RepID=UPI003FCC1394
RSPSSLLHKSRDRYMLTPCSSTSHFVVIELCDEIRIDTLEVGNFEFFSSRIKEVRVRAGESEGEGDGDGEEGEWKDVGTFKLGNVRGLQSFKFPSPTSFHRFLRIDFIGHYGNEYYCPVSLLRIYGMNQMEAYR